MSITLTHEAMAGHAVYCYDDDAFLIENVAHLGPAI
jgi:hypothetical protein